MNTFNRAEMEFPWHVDHLGASTKCIYTSGGWYVADVWGDKDAEFIVKACNQHETLRAALEFIANYKDVSAEGYLGEVIEIARNGLE